MTTAEWSELCAGAPVFLDGAWGTQLQERGLPPGQGSDEWNLSHPDEVEAVAQAYVDAGSQIILTNTFGANPVLLAQHDLADRAREINRIGAERSRRAAGKHVRVFGSIGPTGKMLMMGDITEEEVTAGFELQAEALREGGVDGLVVETMADLQEATLAVKAAATTGLPVVGCMVYDSGPDNDRTMMGTSPQQAAEAFAEAGAWAVGANCGQGPDGFMTLCRQYREATQLPLWLKPNAGLPEMQDGEAVYRMTPESFAQEVKQLIDAGTTFIGGCCGTSPAFIEVLTKNGSI